MDITLKNIAKRYEGNLDYTLQDINLDIKSGEFVALLGPSGCGKTTLLRMLAGLNSITKGDLMFGSTKVNNLEPKDRGIAMVFQSYALYPHMTVYKNMAYSLKIRKVKNDIIDRRVHDVAKILEIEHLLHNKPSEISGGQRQRVALGRAIVRKPSIFLMDEPLSNLDAKLRESMRVELVRIHKMMNTTTIYVTHDQLEAMTMADKIVLFNNKRVQQVGSPVELYNKPANLFVANFIGAPEMNIIEVVKKGTKYFEKVTKNEFTLPADIKKLFVDHDSLKIGVRPENVILSTAPSKAGMTLPVEVITNELIGKETIVATAYSPKGNIRATVPGASKFTYGQKLYAKMDVKKLHVFDPKTTNRLN